ncbi:MAG: murein biosynthesis integral membrane protein MurJ [Thermotogota bacterium]
MSQLFKHSFLFAIATLLSRVLGLFRDATFAHYFGRSSEYDAYLIAILLPFFLRRIFAEGALSSSFIPLFSRKKPEEAQNFLSTTFWLTLFVTILIYIPVFFFSDGFAFVLGSGMAEETISLTGYLMKITYPFIIFISLWAIISGVLNTKDIYFVPALAPALTNISTIVFTFISFLFLPQILGPTIGFTVGGVAQFLFVFFFLRKTGFKIHFYFNVKHVKQIMSLFGPALLGVAVSTFNTLIDTNIATWTGTGGVSTIQYALRLYQLPLGIFAVSVANALLPKLSKAIEKRDKKEYDNFLKESIHLILFFSLPSMAGLIFLNNEIIALIYQHGNFTAQDTLITASTLAFYSFGLPFYSLHGIFVRTFHSDLNTKFPTFVSIVMLASNAILDVLLVRSYGIEGIAMATAISGFVGMVMSGYIAFKSLDPKDLLEIIKVMSSTFMMIIYILLTKNLSEGRLFTIFLVASSILIYFLSAYVTKIKYINKALRIIKIRK